MTIDISLRKFESSRSLVTIIDTPGHGAFLKNMIAGVTQADTAILMISSDQAEFTAGWADGGQTKEQIRIAYAMGIK